MDAMEKEQNLNFAITFLAEAARSIEYRAVINIPIFILTMKTSKSNRCEEKESPEIEKLKDLKDQ